MRKLAIAAAAMLAGGIILAIVFPAPRELIVGIISSALIIFGVGGGVFLTVLYLFKKEEEAGEEHWDTRHTRLYSSWRRDEYKD